MSPAPEVTKFLQRWKAAGAAERANKDTFLLELCDVLGVERPLPKTNDPEQDRYVFEKDVARSREDRTSIGKIDLFRAGCFVLEAKQAKPEERDSPAWEQAMNDAYGQALGYARSLPSPPPFVVVCDIGYCFDLYASFDGSGHYRPFPDAFKKRRYLDRLEELAPELRQLWLDPFALDPSRHQADVTKKVAARIADLSRELEKAGHPPEIVARFLMRCLFTMFAEDVGLLPSKLFSKYLDEYWLPNPDSFPGGVGALWRDMNEGRDTVAGKLLRFNGGLFRDSAALPLAKAHLQLLREAAESNWADVDPSIFGTLLERALDPRERHRLGAHYTPRAYVERLVRPTIEEPLRGDWDLVRAEVKQLVDAGKVADAQARVLDFHHRLCRIRVLDPACGTGNFLYVTLDLFKRLETEVLALLAGLGYGQISLEIRDFSVTPEQFRGIEVKPWAKEIAELVLWIGYLQWQVRQAGEARTIPEPVLRDYGNIECRDAVLAWDGEPELACDEHGKPITRWDGLTMKKSPVTGEDIPDDGARIPVYTYNNPRPAEWPKADYIIGNPPYVGTRRMRLVLGDGYTEALFAAYPEIADTADYVMYWWHRAAEAVRHQRVRRFGLITTNSITQTFNRSVLERQLGASEPFSIAWAVPDHPWVDSADGAAVRVAMTVGEGTSGKGLLVRVEREIEGPEGVAELTFSRDVGSINSDLTAGADVPSAKPLRSNMNIAYWGVKFYGDGFIVTPENATALAEPSGRSLLRPFVSGRDLVGNRRNLLAIDCDGLKEDELAASFPKTYQWLLDRVRPVRQQNPRAFKRERWWIFGENQPGMRRAVAGLARYFVTTETAKHRVFQALASTVLAEGTVTVVAVSEASLLGVLSSRAHLVWALAAGGRLGVGNDPRYNKTRCFDPYPFPSCASDVSEKIGQLAERLDAHRKRQQELFPTLTITGMYNVLEKLRSGEALTAKERVIHEQGLVSVLKEIHDELDAAVFEAYGWPATLSDEEILERLVALNHERAEEEKRGIVRWLRPEFQNPGGRKDAVQEELPGTERKAKGKAAKPAKAEKKAWPKSLPLQVAAVRDLLAEAGSLDLPRAKASFKGAKDEALAAALDSLAALGLAVASEELGTRLWSSVR